MSKRFLDICIIFFSMPLLIILLPLIALISLCFHGRHIIFTQVRPGLNGRPFIMYKFRTMTNDTDINGELLEDKLRITKFGNFLRSSSLDELPELYNVIKGDMSIVGPRPLLMEYLPLYSDYENKRHNIKPGITGWAQVNGRNKSSWKKKFDDDIWYVENSSLYLDIKIIFLTILKVLRRDGVNLSEDKTMTKFDGN
jgi:lipopolysaccharide/colanic/teichoic acid biosynthesis glycosyltransferase